MKETNMDAAAFLKELESEVPASRKCLERIPESLFGWKPHEKSMAMGYLSLLVAEIPKWIQVTIEDSEIDFATFTHARPKTTAELVAHFDENVAGAKKALQRASNADLAGPFHLRSGARLLVTTPKNDSIRSNINHWVHHRGQLTVYMRLNNIPVPSIYGPSADDRSF